MAITSVEQLRAWFSKEKKPTQAQFWALLNSFFHKDEKIHADNVEGLPTSLPACGGNADMLVGKTPSDFASAEQGSLADNAKPYTDEKIGEETLEKVVSRGNTTTHPLHIAEGNADENAATLRQLRFECSELLSTARTEIAAIRGSGALTHDTLKKASEAIDALLAIVSSDDANLDTVHEIVAFIKGNKDVINSISTSKLDKSAFNSFVEQMGSELQSLTSVLAGKAASSHTHSKSQITDFPASLPASDVPAWAKAASKPSYTAAEVGAAVASHTHSKSQITDFPTSLPASDVPAWAKAASKPSYTAAEVEAATASHTHTKAQVTDFPTSMPASDVYAWAKAVSKPSYTAGEVGAVPTSRKVNSKPLSADVTMSAADVGAAAVNHTHTKAQVTDFPVSLPASDVPTWAKAAGKPSYTAGEVGAQPTLVSGQNIKTINGQSILGAGNIETNGGNGQPVFIY